MSEDERQEFSMLCAMAAALLLVSGALALAFHLFFPDESMRERIGAQREEARQ